MYLENIKIPDEMEVMCFDKIDSFSITGFPITYIEQPIKQMGESAVEILMEQLNGNVKTQMIVLSPEIKRLN